MDAGRDITILDAPNAIPGAATFNAVARRLKFIRSESIDISVSKDGGLALEVMGQGGGGGGDVVITSSDASITVTPTSSGYDIRSAVGVTGGTNITVTKSGNTFAVSAPNMITAFAVGSVQTLSPDSPAWVEISGSGASRTIDFGIPRGAKGDPGGIAQGSIQAGAPLAVEIQGGTATLGLAGLDAQSAGIVMLRNGTFSVLPIGNGVLVGNGTATSWIETATCDNA